MALPIDLLQTRGTPAASAAATARSRTLARIPMLGRAHAPAGALVNTILRLGIIAMSIDAIVNGSDQRYAGKSLGMRDVIISFGLAMVFPVFWKLRYRKREWSKYPWWYDDLYLSIFFVDMLGNSLNPYNLWLEWDHIPHSHGPGALAMVFAGIGVILYGLIWWQVSTLQRKRARPVRRQQV